MRLGGNHDPLFKDPLQASLVKQFVVPNMAWFGWIVFLMEAFVAVSLIFGLFTRLGGLAALIQGLNLYFGVTAAPGEWYWTYGMLYTLGLIFLAIPAGRVLGLDAWLASAPPSVQQIKATAWQNFTRPHLTKQRCPVLQNGWLPSWDFF